MLKRVLAFLLIVGCFSQVCVGINSYARQVDDSNIVVEQVYEDGSYIESTIEQNDQEGYVRSSTVSGSKKYSYKNSSGKVIWTAVLHGNFTYNGTSAKCISTSLTVSISNHSGKVTEKNNYASGSSAVGKMVTKRYVSGVAVQTVSRTLKLTCTVSGKLK